MITAVLGDACMAIPMATQTTLSYDRLLDLRTAPATAAVVR